jgi:molybdate transport repressor ModE-like protein
VKFDWRRMNLLAEVARCGSITAAAQALSYTPSAVSQQIARLEREIGQPLLERHARGITLTEAGRIVVMHAENIDREMDAARSELDDLAGLRVGSVRLATFPTAAAALLPPVVAAFRSAHPAVHLSVRCALIGGLNELVDRREVDLALMWEYDWCPIDKPNVEIVHLANDPICLVLSRTHRLAHHQSIELSTLADESWIVRNDHSVADMLVRNCRAVGFSPTIVYEASDYQEIQAMVAMGLGIALVPRLALVNVREDVVTVQPGPTPNERHVVLAHFGERTMTPATRQLRDTLLATIVG